MNNNEIANHQTSNRERDIKTQKTNQRIRIKTEIKAGFYRRAE